MIKIPFSGKIKEVLVGYLEAYMDNIDKNLLERIELIEQEKYPVKRMTKKDYIEAAIFTLLCLVLVIGGLFV